MSQLSFCVVVALMVTTVFVGVQLLHTAMFWMHPFIGDLGPLAPPLVFFGSLSFLAGLSWLRRQAISVVRRFRRPPPPMLNGGYVWWF